jgi:hypothetical protein
LHRNCNFHYKIRNIWNTIAIIKDLSSEKTWLQFYSIIHKESHKYCFCWCKRICKKGFCLYSQNLFDHLREFLKKPPQIAWGWWKSLNFIHFIMHYNQECCKKKLNYPIPICKIFQLFQKGSPKFLCPPPILMEV